MKEYRIKDYFYIKFLFFLRYFADALFYSYTALYLSSIGLKEGVIGTISSITTITCLIVNPIWTILARKNKIVRIMLIVLSIIEGTIIFIYGNIDVVGILMILTSLAAIVAAPYYNVLDGYCASYCEKYSKQYPKIRFMGSIAYVIAIGICALFIDYIGFTKLFMISGILFILVGILASFLPKITYENKIERISFKDLFKNKFFVVYLIVYLLTISISTVADNYISLFFTNVKGLTISQYSYVSMGILITEAVTLFFASNFLNKVKPAKIFLSISLIYTFRSLMIGLNNIPIAFLVFCACLRGVSWGLFLFIHVKYIMKIVGVEKLTTAIQIISIASAFFQVIFANIFGYSIQNFGYSINYLIIAIIIFFVGISYFIYNYSTQYCKKNNEND